MKKISIFVLLVVSMLAASCSFAFDPITLKDGKTGNTAILYPTVKEEDKGLLFYSNPTFGYCVNIPDVFTKVVLIPDNGDGIALTTKDGKAAFRVSGGHVIDDDMLKESYDSALQSIGGKDEAVFFDIGNDSWELTWWKGDTFHSRKFLMRGEEAWCDCEISYKSIMSEEVYDPFDEIASRAIKSIAFPEGQ